MIKKLLSFVLMVSVFAINFGFIGVTTPQTVEAAGVVTAFSDTVSNLSASTVANHTIQFTTPTGVAATTGTIILTFNNSTSTGSVDYTDIDIKDDGADLTINGASPSGAAWGAVNTGGGVITLTNGSTAVAAGSVVNIEIGTNATYTVQGTHQMTNGVAGSTILRLSGTFGDAGTLSMSIITNSVVQVSAEVLATLSFAISSNALYFGNLNPSGPCFARNTNPGFVTCPQTTDSPAFTMTASTNGNSGYSISVVGDTLRSGLSNTITPNASALGSSFGNEQFGLTISPSGGSGTAVAPYATAGSYAYTATTATPVTVASASIPSLNTTYSVSYIANIAATTEAGSYTTAHTYVATGNF